jgi:hypothetical protein
MKLIAAEIRLKAVDTTTIIGTNFAIIFKILTILIASLICLSVEDNECEEDDNTTYL